MIQSDDHTARLCIPQPSHAWMSGRMAESWRDAIEPRAEVVSGAAEHDCGWIEWEENPTLNPATGLPHNFSELTTPEHLEIWRRGPCRAAVANRFTGLVVSLHGTGLYERFGNRSDPLVAAYLDEETARQREIREDLGRDPYYAPHVTESALRRIQTLVAAWDMLSLDLCRGRRAGVYTGVPFEGGVVDLALRPIEGSPALTIDPWPFRDRAVTFYCDAFHLRPGFADLAGLRRAVVRAPRFRAEFSFEAV